MTQRNVSGRLSDEQWEMIKHIFEAGANVTNLSNKYGVSASTIYRRAKKYNWQRTKAKDGAEVSKNMKEKLFSIMPEYTKAVRHDIHRLLDNMGEGVIVNQTLESDAFHTEDSFASLWLIPLHHRVFDKIGLIVDSLVKLNKIESKASEVDGSIAEDCNGIDPKWVLEIGQNMKIFEGYLNPFLVSSRQACMKEILSWGAVDPTL